MVLYYLLLIGCHKKIFKMSSGYVVVWTPDPYEKARGAESVAEKAPDLNQAYIKRLEMITRYLPVSRLPGEDFKDRAALIHRTLMQPNGVEALKAQFAMVDVPMNDWNIEIVNLQ